MKPMIRMTPRNTHWHCNHKKYLISPHTHSPLYDLSLLDILTSMQTCLLQKMSPNLTQIVLHSLLWGSFLSLLLLLSGPFLLFLGGFSPFVLTISAVVVDTESVRRNGSFVCEKVEGEVVFFVLVLVFFVVVAAVGFVETQANHLYCRSGGTDWFFLNFYGRGK